MNSQIVHTNHASRYGFCFIKCGEYHLGMRMEDGYINADQLCEIDGKDFNDWFTAESSKKLVDAINQELQSQPESKRKDCVFQLFSSTLSSEFQGYFVHPILVPFILSWCSPNFAVEMIRYLNPSAFEERPVNVDNPTQVT